MIDNNEDLQAIRDQAQRFLSDRAEPEHLKALLEQPGSFDMDSWTAAAELGWPLLALAEEQGGLGLGLRGLSVLYAEMGRSNLSLPLLSGYVLSLMASGNDATTDALTAVAEGRAIVALGLAHEKSSTNRSLQLNGDTNTLSGESSIIPFAAVADYALLSVGLEDDTGVVLVELSQDNCKKTIVSSFDNARGYARLSFSKAQCVVLADKQPAQAKIQDGLAVAALVTAFEQNSGAESAMLLAREYALERKVFGQKIGGFQAIKHKIADMYWRIELAKGCAIDALLAYEAENATWRELAAAARIAAIEAYEFSAKECMQTFGGLGSTWEGMPHHHYRRSRVLAQEIGARQQWREQFFDFFDARDKDAEIKIEALDELVEYRAAARTWLAENASAYAGDRRKGLSFAEDLALGRQWLAKKADAGYGCINLPKEYGGGGLTELHKIVFGEEELRYQLPTEYFVISTAQLMAIFLRYAPEEARRELGPKALRGDEIWCQMFSEPGAGSDLAAVRLKAERETRDGVEGWVLNGQKLWTSWAQVADWGFIVARTDGSGAKHAGITCFYSAMNAEGITVRPIRRMAGHDDVNEVFFDNVFVPDTQRLGDEGRGFGVAMEMLMVERVAGVYDESCGGASLDMLLAKCRDVELNGRPAIEDGEVRATLVEAYVERQGLRSIYRRGMEAVGKGVEPGPEGAIRKLVMGRARQRLGALALDLMGPEGLYMDVNGSDRTDFAWSWIDPAARIAGGTDEVLLNTVGEKVLGLPQDHRPDKNIPFNQVG